MKIGLDVSLTGGERSGLGWFADSLARALIAEGLARGHTFELYHHFGDSIAADPWRGTRVDASHVSAPLLGLDPAAARKFWRDVESGEPLPGKPEVVISLSQCAPRLPHTKLVYTVHDLVFWLHPEFSTEAARLAGQRELLQALARAAGLLFVSGQTQRDFEAILPNWLEHTGRPHALSPGASRYPLADLPRDWSADAPWLIVGSLEPRKNHRCALEAYEIYLSQSQFRRPLVIAGGRGWFSETVHTRIASMIDRGLPVRPPCYLPDSELAKLYRGAFALLAPSWHEGAALPLVEAMGAGLPTIASLRGSLPEIGGEAPRYVAPENPEGFAAAMLALEADAESYARRAQASLDRAHEFSWTSTARSVLEFIGKL